MYRRYRTTKSWQLLELARSPDIPHSQLEEIAAELHERKNPVALEALLEVGSILQAANEKGLRIRHAKRQQEWRRRAAEGYFEWPSTDAPAVVHGYVGDVFSYKEGLLSYVGYRVGHGGESTDVRQHTLDCVFHNRLPRVNSPEYMTPWGEPATPARLKKLAATIATFTRNAKRQRGVSMGQAVADWESDLWYLCETYYIGKFGFAWPST